MHKNLYVIGSRIPRPPSERAIFCDGGADDTFREGIDLELSHWIPNRTPRAFKASTSTEISFEFLAKGEDSASFDLVLNNHLDVDGVLSVFTLLFDELAVQHRSTLVEAAELGDFGAWGRPRAQQLFQALALLMVQLREAKTDLQEAYVRCFRRAEAVLNGERFAECRPGLRALAEASARIERGDVKREILTQHLVQYVVPRRLADLDTLAALYVPSFNSPLSPRTLLPLPARARLDAERIQLVSIETEQGWYHDLWFPGYSWAETIGLWRPPGLRDSGSSNLHYLELPSLGQAAADLQTAERGSGRWVLARQLSPFEAVSGRGFPVVLSCMAAARSAPSSLAPATVAERLKVVFE